MTADRPTRRRAALSITCGIDWAEAHCDIAFVEADGTVAKLPIDTGLPRFTALMGLIVEHADKYATVPCHRDGQEPHRRLFDVEGGAHHRRGAEGAVARARQPAGEQSADAARRRR